MSEGRKGREGDGERKGNEQGARERGEVRAGMAAKYSTFL